MRTILREAVGRDRATKVRRRAAPQKLARKQAIRDELLVVKPKKPVAAGNKPGAALSSVPAGRTMEAALR